MHNFICNFSAEYHTFIWEPKGAKIEQNLCLDVIKINIFGWKTSSHKKSCKNIKKKLHLLMHWHVPTLIFYPSFKENYIYQQNVLHLYNVGPRIFPWPPTHFSLTPDALLLDLDSLFFRVGKRQFCCLVETNFISFEIGNPLKKLKKTQQWLILEEITKKSCIPKTKHVLTDADSNTDTIVGWTKRQNSKTQKCLEICQN